MWSRNQVIKVQIYRRAAGLAEVDYRHLLKTHTGAFSSKAKTLTQFDFDTFMPVLEMKVEDHHRATETPLPKQIGKIRYWRTRCPRNGSINSRQRRKIFAIWEELKPHLAEQPADEMAYLAHIAQQACGYRIPSVWDMKAWQASLLIEALKDRLQHETTRRKAS